MGENELHDAAAICDEGEPPFLGQRDDAFRGFHVLQQTRLSKPKVLRPGEPN
jgi:hypothetical protein